MNNEELLQEIKEDAQRLRIKIEQLEDILDMPEFQTLSAINYEICNLISD